MVSTEEVQQMKSRGATDQEIVQALQSKGMPVQQAYEALSQATIKNAVVQEPSVQEPDVNSSSLQPSLMGGDPERAQAEQPAMQYEQYAQYPQEQQYADSSYSPQLSTDTISEIADQILSEKIATIRDSIEKIIDFKTSSETKINILDERLQKIEKIIDRLQLSILQKVGESITNIEDLKKEIIETQKTVKAIVPASHRLKTQEE